MTVNMIKLFSITYKSIRFFFIIVDGVNVTLLV